jgi:nucleotide-binding universal stress UspA family protein
MDGCGRTRLSELVLGGVTRHVLAHSPSPPLLSH